MQTGKRVIIVKDEIIYVRSMADELRKLGHEVVVCRNATEVFEAFAAPAPNNRKFDLVITDSQLAHGDEFTTTETENYSRTGLALYRHLRASEGSELSFLFYISDKYLTKELEDIHDPHLQVMSIVTDPSWKVAATAADLLNSR